MKPTSAASVSALMSAAVRAAHPLVDDFVVPPADRDQAGRAYADAITQTVGERELWCCQASPDDLADWLRQTGWQKSRSIPDAEAVPNGFWHRHDALAPMRLIQLIEAHN